MSLDSLRMDLSSTNVNVPHELVSHVEDGGSDAFMLSSSIDYDDDHSLAHVITRSEGGEPVGLPNIDGVPYLLDIETDCLLTETANLSNQVDDAYQSSAISLHSYSQALPSMTSECLHNYSQPIGLPVVGAKTEVLHNYSQPWPQSTDSFTSVHNYCINNDTSDQIKDAQPHNEVKIYKLSKSDTSDKEEHPPMSLKLQLVDSYICQWKDCDMGFTTTQALAEHVGEHIQSQISGIYHCLWKNCPRNEHVFYRRYLLVQHVRMHTAERPHKCSLCDVEFSSAEGLTKHQRVHTGEKPYPCTYSGCLKAFKNSGDRSRHLKSHRIKYGYPCKHVGCGKLYTDPSSLRKHVKVKHPSSAPQHSVGPVIEKRIQAATLLSTNGLETNLDVNELAFSNINGTLYCEDSTLMASAGIKSSENDKVKSSLTVSQETPINLSSNDPQANNWITFNPLDDT